MSPDRSHQCSDREAHLPRNAISTQKKIASNKPQKKKSIEAKTIKYLSFCKPLFALGCPLMRSLYIQQSTIIVLTSFMTIRNDKVCGNGNPIRRHPMLDSFAMLSLEEISFTFHDVCMHVCRWAFRVFRKSPIEAELLGRVEPTAATTFSKVH